MTLELTRELPQLTITPSIYQRSLFEEVVYSFNDLVVEAVPGSGKTTSLKEIARLLPHSRSHSSKKISAVFCAFNTHIANPLAQVFKDAGLTYITAKTIHSLGNSILWKNRLGGKADARKYRWIAQDQIESLNTWRKNNNKGELDTEIDYAQALYKMSEFARLTLTDERDEKALFEMCQHYGLDECLSAFKVIWKQVNFVLSTGIEQARRGKIDFTDMIWLPTRLNLPRERYDFILIDEAQDLNNAQLELVLSSRAPQGRLIFVGDRHQAIMGFAGANTDSMDNIISKTGAQVLPLSICYRCPSSHVNLASSVFSGIEAASWAKQGVISSVSENELVGAIREGDGVICRITAPLISTCFSLIKQGVSAKVRGRDIGENLKSLLKQVSKRKSFKFEMLVASIEDYRERTKSALQEKGADDSALLAVDDKVDTLLAIYESADPKPESVKDLEQAIDELFSDERASVILSTVHRAKGLEWDRVFILQPEKMPHKMAKKAHELIQEENIRYVAYTRAKEELIFVSSK